MSNFHERISLQAKTIRNRMNVSVQPERSITIPISNLEAAIRPRLQKENVKNVSITVDSQGLQFQPEGSLTIPVKDLEVTIRTSLQRNNSTSVMEITEAREGSETKANNLESVSSKKRGNLECVSLEKRDDLKSLVGEWINSINTERDKIKNVTIRRPFFSVEKISNLFQPRVISIGPVHSRLTMEPLKWESLNALSDNEIEDCFERIKNLEESARGCYQSKIELSSDEFVKILFLDSMFIILLLIDDANSCCSGKLSYVFDDLLMLQNQIPFFILQQTWNVVFRHCYVSADIGSSSYTDLATIFQQTRFGRADLDNSLVFDDICHLLDLYCKWVVPIPARVSNCQPQIQVPNWFLLCRPSWFRSWFSQPQTQARDKGTISSTPSATELYKAGVKFKPKEKFMNFLDISFENGILEIPTLTLNLSSMSLLANVLSHVNTNVVSQEVYITSYVFFMDSLIRTKKDVVLLQKFGVLDNKLKSSDEAADFIKSLGECIGTLPVDDVNINFYAPMIQDMMKYTASCWRRNWASLKLTYFSNLWKGISVIAGSSLLIIAFVQTYYSAYPYYHHHN